MTKIATHRNIPGNECTETLHLFRLEGDDFWDLENDKDAVLRSLGFEDDTNPPPGAVYTKIDYYWTTVVLVVIEHSAYNC